MKRPNPYIDLPLTAGKVVYTLIAAVIYLAQLVCGSLCGFFWFTLGKKDERKRERFHRMMYKCFNADIRLHPWWNLEVHNPYGETFTRGAILICNHQSMLDTFCLMALSPRILIMTQDKVWNNPLVAAVLRYADFFSISDPEWENRLAYCKSFIDRGWSVLLFPEGMRSREGNILRFHKGSFFLAERLHADILPVFLHGAAHIMPVGSMWGNRGCFYIEVGRRVTPDDRTFGAGYGERCVQMHRYYQEHFEEMRYRLETPAYFRSLAVSLYAAIGLRRTAAKVLDGNLPDDCHVTVLVDALVHPEREYVLPASSPLRKLYRKCNHLPENIKFE